MTATCSDISDISSSSRLARRFVCAALATLCVLALGACRIASTERIELPLPTDIERLAVDVTNTRGSVRVYANEANEGQAVVVLNVSRNMLHGYEGDQQSLPASHTMEVGAEVVETDGGPVLVVNATGPLVEEFGQHADITVFVPRADGLNVTNSGGNVEVLGVSGATQISNAYGLVLLRSAHPIDAPIQILNTSGSVFMFLSEDSKAVFDVHAMDGPVWLDPDAKRLFDWTRWTSDGVQGSLNSGRHEVLVRTDDGKIRIDLEEPTSRALQQR